MQIEEMMGGMLNQMKRYLEEEIEKVLIKIIMIGVMEVEWMKGYEEIEVGYGI